MSKLIARIISHTSDAFWDQAFSATYFLKHFGEVCWKTNPREVCGPDSLLMQWIFCGWWSGHIWLWQIVFAVKWEKLYWLYSFGSLCKTKHSALPVRHPNLQHFLISVFINKCLLVLLFHLFKNFSDCWFGQCHSFYCLADILVFQPMMASSACIDSTLDLILKVQVNSYQTQIQHFKSTRDFLST